MLSSNTPFKIHDENSTVFQSGMKSVSKAKIGGLTSSKLSSIADDSFTPMKFGKDLTGTSSKYGRKDRLNYEITCCHLLYATLVTPHYRPRKALGEVSTSQLNQTAQKSTSTPFHQNLKASAIKTSTKIAPPSAINNENVSSALGSVHKVKFCLEPTIDDVRTEIINI